MKQKRTKPTEKIKIIDETISAWDMLLITLQILYKYLHYWVRLNLRCFISSIPIVTIPTANAMLYSGIHSTMLSQGILETKEEVNVDSRVRSLLWRATLLAVIQLVFFAVIVVSIYFWISRPELVLNFISIISFYALVLLWLAAGYINPFLVFNPGISIKQCLQKAFVLIMKNPFKSLLYAVVNTLLLVFGLALLGPILLVIPVARALIFYMSYMYMTGNLKRVNLSM